MSPSQEGYLSGFLLTNDTSMDSGCTTAGPVSELGVVSRAYPILSRGKKGKTYSEGSTKVVKTSPKHSLKEVKKPPRPYSTQKDRDLMVILLLYVQRRCIGHKNHEMSNGNLASQLSDPVNRQQREDYVNREQFMIWASSRYSTGDSWHVHESTPLLPRDDKDGMEGVESTKGDEGKQPCYECFLLGGT